MKISRFAIARRRLIWALSGANLAALTLAASATASGGAAGAVGRPASFLGHLRGVSKVASTVPANGDVNPYGLAVVPTSGGQLVQGVALVRNFNDEANVQGTGSTIVEVSPSGTTQLFSDLGTLPSTMRCPGGVGLTTALGVLPGGWVVVGSLPTTTGGALPSLNPAGCLIVLDDEGTPVETITNPNVAGPWDMAIESSGSSAALFVSNALGDNTKTTANGTPATGKCTVVRVDLTLSAGSPPVVTGTTIIGTGYPWRADKAALVLAPTGLALSDKGTLDVDDTETNTVSAIPNALTRTTAISAAASTISSGGALQAPLGMTVVPNGDIVVVNGNNGKAVELSPKGRQLATKTLARKGAGDLFGVTVDPTSGGILFVNDGTNTLDLVRP